MEDPTAIHRESRNFRFHNRSGADNYIAAVEYLEQICGEEN